jgi:hypothetical protein
MNYYIVFEENKIKKSCNHTNGFKLITSEFGLEEFKGSIFKYLETEIKSNLNIHMAKDNKIFTETKTGDDIQNLIEIKELSNEDYKILCKIFTKQFGTLELI